MTRIAIVAGELSGDHLAAGLIREIKARRPDIHFEGVTGPGMRAAGCESLFPYDELAVMGLAEVVKHLPRLLRRRRELVEHWRASPPAAFIGIDAPDFNIGLARRLRADVPACVQYVCPSVWAWRQGRVKSIRKASDLVLCLLPFEVDFLNRHEVNAAFVGHPLASELANYHSVDAARSALGLEDRPTLALLPGSRRGEVERLAESFLKSATLLQASRPGLHVVAALANPATAEIFDSQRKAFAADVEVVVGRTRDVIAAADAVLVASGTATLETALLRRPMAVAYKLNSFTYWLVKQLKLMKISHYSLPNLLAGEAVVPEFVQQDATPSAMADALSKLLDDSPERAQQLMEFDRLSSTLSGDANALAADAVLALDSLN